MKKAITSGIIVNLFVLSTFAQSQLAEYCIQTGGEVVTSWTCPENGTTRTGEFCHQQTDLGEDMIFNGCSAPEGEFKEVFFRACIIHDLCYHHEPTSNNKSKASCDNQFLDNMKKICKTSSGGAKCLLTAQTYYVAVVKGGQTAFNCSKEKADYPQDMDKLPLPSPAP